MKLDDAIDWLTALEKALNKYHPPTNPRDYGHVQELRKVTEEEWKTVQALVAEHHFGVVPYNACMGFNFGIAIYKGPPYPSAPAELLVRINGEHFGLHFSDAWDRMSPLSHNDRNAGIIAFFGFEPLKEKGHYDY